jgi:Tol biopolymer transport system component
MRAQRLELALSCLLFTLTILPTLAQDAGRDVTRSLVTVMDADGKSPRVVLDSNLRFNAPSWSPDGSFLILSGGGMLWRVPVSGGQKPEEIRTASVGWVDINHGISPDGKSVAFSATGALWVVPLGGGEARRVTSKVPTYFHGWSPDGKTLVCAARRGRGCEVMALEAAGGTERPLTTEGSYSDSASYSADGAWVYFNADYSGTSALWRVPATVGAKAERVFADARVNWHPRPSPDGRWLLFLSYAPKTAGQPSDRDVVLRRIPLPGTEVRPAKTEELVRFVGGHGSLGSRPWSPNGHQFAFVRYGPAPPTLRIVLFTPSDVAVPPGVKSRLTQVANTTEKFYFEGMKHWGYSPAAKGLFRREADGSVEVLQVRGEDTAASGKYAKPNFGGYVIDRATEQYHVAGEGHVWWIFVYLGDRPTRFEEFIGGGNPREGGRAMVNYDSLAGEIRSDLGLAKGFNGQFMLKGVIHELGHALGLPHAGPEPSLGLGNSLMGPTTAIYSARNCPKPEQVYLSESSAAMLWKHPLFSGTAKDRVLQPRLELANYRAQYSLAEDRVTLSGKLVTDQPAHSVVVTEDRGQPRGGEYWYRQHSARLAPDGTFRVTFDHPPKADCQYRFRFCFENGVVTGDGVSLGIDAGDIRKAFRVGDGRSESVD